MFWLFLPEYRCLLGLDVVLFFILLLPSSLRCWTSKCISTRDDGKQREVPMLGKVLFCLAVLAAAVVVSAGKSHGQMKKDAPTSADVAHGKYLVEEVAKCAECHTPRDGRGELKQSAWLRGAPIWIEPVTRIADWADSAPPLAGLPSLSDQQAETVLEKGTGPEGETLRPPMHIYHMKHEDAKAIVAYLKSLPRGAPER